MPFLENCEEAHTKTSIHHVITKKSFKIEYTKLYVASLLVIFSIQKSNTDNQSETTLKVNRYYCRHFSVAVSFSKISFRNSGHFHNIMNTFKVWKSNTLIPRNLRNSIICGLHFIPNPRNLRQKFDNLRFSNFEKCNLANKIHQTWLNFMKMTPF